jgi:hypothetical protein
VQQREELSKRACAFLRVKKTFRALSHSSLALNEHKKQTGHARPVFLFVRLRDKEKGREERRDDDARRRVGGGGKCRR